MWFRTLSFQIVVINCSKVEVQLNVITKDLKAVFAKSVAYIWLQLIDPICYFPPIFHMGKENLNQTVFLKNLPSTKFIFNFKGVTHRIQLTLI